MNRVLVSFATAVVVGASFGSAQDASHCGVMQDHHAQVDERGDHVMGFAHDKTTHHFRLTRDGGAIEVTANEPNDTESVEAIRGHLAHIAKLFAAGDFQAPMLIHDRVPPGVPVMKRDKEKIVWKYADIEAGGQVSAVSKDAKDRDAIHEFLRFQIEDHRTGDSTEVAGAR